MRWRRVAGALTLAVSLAPAGVVASPASAATPLLALGSRGPAVVTLQRHLAGLGYWLGPVTGVVNDATQQAVFAIQKAAGLSRDGIVGPLTQGAIARGVRPKPHSTRGAVVEINLSTNLLLLVRDGRLVATLNVSTGGGYPYSMNGVSGVAVTPRGQFRVFRQVNGLDVSPLGEMWRPKYFSGGFAIHGSAFVPPQPASHGCVRVSNAAMDWIWASNRMPIGTLVWIY